VGHTYGRQWFLENFERIYAGLGPTAEDPTEIRDWCVFLPAYDGGDAYQWLSGANCAGVVQLMRRTVDAGGHGYVGYEWPGGQVHWGDTFPTWTQENAGCIDVHLIELPPGPYPFAHGTDGYNACNAQLGRFCKPWNPPADFQPGIDDRWPMPFYPMQTPRGPQIVQVYEFRTYWFVRDRDIPACNRDRQWIRDRVPAAIIC
jgi:hypothetical protein